MKNIRVIDLFAGVGGIRLGFQQAAKELGLTTECVFTSEIDNRAFPIGSFSMLIGCCILAIENKITNAN